jgi:hypothetical protein
MWMLSAPSVPQVGFSFAKTSGTEGICICMHGVLSICVVFSEAVFFNVSQ